MIEGLTVFLVGFVNPLVLHWTPAARVSGYLLTRWSDFLREGEKCGEAVILHRKSDAFPIFYACWLVKLV